MNAYERLMNHNFTKTKGRYAQNVLEMPLVYLHITFIRDIRNVKLKLGGLSLKSRNSQAGK